MAFFTDTLRMVVGITYRDAEILAKHYDAISKGRRLTQRDFNRPTKRHLSAANQTKNDTGHKLQSLGLEDVRRSLHLYFV